MDLYLQAKTKAIDLVIDYFEVSLTDGTNVSLNWDESRIDRDDRRFSAIYESIFFNESHADSGIDELQNMRIAAIDLYSEVQSLATILITKMFF